ncbi:MAG: hypothetical protein ABID38_07290 [Candidatus Diapherotrites archaeon]
MVNLTGNDLKVIAGILCEYASPDAKAYFLDNLAKKIAKRAKVKLKEARKVMAGHVTDSTVKENLLILKKEKLLELGGCRE